MENKKFKLVSPMVFQVKNVSDEKKEWFLFGFNEFSAKPNFGNDPDVRVTSLNGISYDNHINNTSKEGFMIGQMRFSSQKSKELQQTVFLHKNNYITGKYTRKQLNLAVMRDAYQQQADILDVKRQWKISRKTYMSGEIQPESIIIISIYPQIEDKQIPRLSGNNLAPVIIHTTKAIPNKDIIGGKKLSSKKTKNK